VGEVTSTPADQPALGARPALVLAGGGHKVAFQAGVLQVWLDEARLPFQLADGTSGGTLNLAMWCQGMSGRQIADNWRRLSPTRGIAINWRGVRRGPLAASMFTFDRYRRTIFPDWGLDLERIASTDREATFNVYDFTRHELVAHPADQMTEDLLVACNSIPFWFPPVEVEDRTYVDAVTLLDANIEEVIARGADDVFVIWTVSQRGVWRDGFVAQYFQTIEEAAYGGFRRLCDRVERSNQRFLDGKPSEFDRFVRLRVLAAEVPLHYIVNFSRDRMAASVELGVREARRWCAANGIPLRPAEEVEAAAAPYPGYDLSFSEEMNGWFSFAEGDPSSAARRGRAEDTRLKLHLDVHVDGIARFVVDPDRTARVEGWLHAEALGGRCVVESGELNLFSSDPDPGATTMRYTLRFRDAVGHPLTLVGLKRLADDPGWDLWSDATTLFVTLHAGHLDAAADDPSSDAGSQGLLGSGIVRISPLGVLGQLLSVRSDARSLPQRAEAAMRFGQFFLGRLFDVYGQPVLSSSPL
jgi:predicted patatin/cPLA2 family phospholipase